MNAARQALTLALLMLALACAGWYFASSAPKFKLDAKALSVLPDMIIYGLEVKQFNDKGVLVNELHTPMLTHVQAQDKHILKDPEIRIVQQEGKPAWKIESQEAVALHNGEEITFYRQVRVEQPKGENSPGSLLTTEQIVYYPKTNQAMTDLPVMFAQPGTVVHSTGMRADLAKQQVQLLHQARGSYVPNQG